MRSRALALAGVAAVGCVLFEPTPYQAEGYRGGYADFEVPGKPGLYYVRFGGNGNTGRATVVKYWHQRATELCPGGYDVVSSESSERVETTTSPQQSQTMCTGGGNTGPPVQCQQMAIGGGSSTSVKPAMEGYITCHGGER